MLHLLSKNSIGLEHYDDRKALCNLGNAFQIVPVKTQEFFDDTFLLYFLHFFSLLSSWFLGQIFNVELLQVMQFLHYAFMW